MKRTILLLAFITVPLPGLAWDYSGKAAFRSGLKQLSEGEYEVAAESFTAAHRKLPLLGDYALLYLGRAYLGMEKPEPSGKAIEMLLKNYPDTPVRKQAREIEILNALAASHESALPLLEAHAEEFPTDTRMKFLLGKLLLYKDLPGKANRVFKDLYIKGGGMSEQAYMLIRPPGLSPPELFERARHLIGHKNYAGAEAALNDALKGDDGTLRDDILKNLGLALYRQKKYPNAARAYMEAGELYHASTSFLRAGETRSFRETLRKMVAEENEGAATLMITEAEELRRKGNADKALAVLEEVMEKFPSASEAALWRTGWVHYTRGDLINSISTFDRLSTSYPSSKYLYWKARALEKYGEDASVLFSSIDGRDYYGFISRLKTGIVKSMAPRKPLTAKGNALLRIDALLELGLADEAAAEINLMAASAVSDEKIIEMAYRLKDMKRYREAILLARRLPEEKRPDDILYPLAYWPAVKGASSMHSVDPFLLLSVIREESRFDRNALSPAGAMGLMQLMPRVAEHTSHRLSMSLNGTDSIYDTDNNIILGSYCLSSLIKKFESVPAALAAYNAGERRVRGWLEKGDYESTDEFIEDIPYKETRQYIKRIITTYFRYRGARYRQFTGEAGIL
jgi:soluble lytic murein transglycosylase